MTFLEALYGSQYQDLVANGKDGSNGRINGNIFLAVLITLVLFTLFGFIMLLSSTFFQQSSHFISNNFISGKSAGKLLAIPVIALSYYIVSKTVGSEISYQKSIHSFLQLPAEIRKQANKKLLTYFFIVLGSLVLVLILL